MKNYNTTYLEKLTGKERRDYIFNFYRDKIQPFTAVNRETGITIHFNKKGRHKTASLNASLEKSVVILHLPELLTSAIRIKTVEVKNGSSIQRNVPDAVYVVNFLIKCKINEKVAKFICGVILTSAGKFQYSLYHSNPKKINAG